MSETRRRWPRGSVFRGEGSPRDLDSLQRPETPSSEDRVDALRSHLAACSALVSAKDEEIRSLEAELESVKGRNRKLERLAEAARWMFQPYQATGSHADANMEAEHWRRLNALRAAVTDLGDTDG